MGKLADVRAALAACSEAHSEPISKIQVVTWIREKYPDADFNPNTLQAQLYRSCVNVLSARNSSAPKIIRYEKSSKTYSRLPQGYVEADSLLRDSTNYDGDEELEVDSKFALEAHLRDYLAKNLGLLEPGLTLWTGTEAESVEYALENRRIDILAKDRGGVPVVVELKLSRGHERTLGQALYYRGKLKQLLKVSRVRIIMVAGEITEELRIASTEVSDVDVFSYKLTMQVQKIDLTAIALEEAVLTPE